MPRVVLKPRRARPFYGRHPWVFAGAIADVEGDPGDGGEVDLVSHAGQFIARGLYNGRSKIRVRLYSWTPDRPLDEAFFAERLEAAIRLRREVLRLDEPGRGCRLVFSEADGLSGLTVDRFDRWLVVQFTSLALAQRREILARLLLERTSAEGVYLRTEKGVGESEGIELHDGLLVGNVPDRPVLIDEDGLKFQVHIQEGQKTGFYLDQRANREAVARLAVGRRVLDAFCYSGGFALHAARAGAASVLAVDSSEAALALAQANAQLNGLDVALLRDDVFHALDVLIAEGRRFDLVILDPPKFARARRSIDEALRGYRRLQTLAMRLLDPDGLLVVCCCSGLISQEMLENLLAQIAVEERRELRILERRGQAADHPVSVSCLEGAYLKCLICHLQ